MNLIAGIVIVTASVLGGFVLSHGHLYALWQPYELIIIGGAALGAFVIANPGKIIVAATKGLPTLLKPSPYNKALYMEALSLLYALFQKIRKDGLIAVEGDIDDPDSSPLFEPFEKIRKDHATMDFIRDNIRLMLTGSLDSFQLDNLMTLELETHHEEAEQPAHAIYKVADSLPGFGIVAAVLGIVITMGSLGGDTAEIGHHVAAALVGTFLGILLAYGFVAPVSVAMEGRANDQSKFLGCVKTAILATVQGYSPQIAVEFARKVIYHSVRPSFQELEEHVRGKPA